MNKLRVKYTNFAHIRNESYTGEENLSHYEHNSDEEIWNSFKAGKDDVFNFIYKK